MMVPYFHFPSAYFEHRILFCDLALYKILIACSKYIHRHTYSYILILNFLIGKVPLQHSRVVNPDTTLFSQTPDQCLDFYCIYTHVYLYIREMLWATSLPIWQKRTLLHTNKAHVCCSQLVE